MSRDERGRYRRRAGLDGVMMGRECVVLQLSEPHLPRLFSAPFSRILAFMARPLPGICTSALPRLVMALRLPFPAATKSVSS